MNYDRKGRSPFYPGQPVPQELFVGRAAEVERIRRASYQVAAGKPQALFITGEYGIGKSSLAKFMQSAAERDPRLLGFHVTLGTAMSLADVAQATVRAVAESTGSAARKVRGFLADYIKEVSLVGVVKFHVEKLRRDAVDISDGFLPFLDNVHAQVRDEYKGLMLILDEINGLAGEPIFSRFLKDLVDANALRSTPLPLLLIVCGTDDRRQQLIANHQPVDRIFDVAMIDTMSDKEVREFYERAFAQAEMGIDDAAVDELCRHSGGLPKLMHLLGEAAFWIAPDHVDLNVARQAVHAAMEDVGRKFVAPQLRRLVCDDAHRVPLRSLADTGTGLVLTRETVGRSLEDQEAFSKLSRELEELGVIHLDEESGRIVFRDRLTRLYLSMAATLPVTTTPSDDERS